MAIDSQLRLARDGGTPARTSPERPMFPGGMEVGDEELAALERVIRSRNLFRYYGVGEGPQEVAAFEREFAQHMGAERALAVNATGPGPDEAAHSPATSASQRRFRACASIASRSSSSGAGIRSCSTTSQPE